jgi:hypothetical protein
VESSTAGEGIATTDESLPAERGAREQVDEKEIILHGRVDLSLGIGTICSPSSKISETS